jgi:hypothetical protein
LWGRAFYDSVSKLGYIVLNDGMIEELKMIWKEAVVASSRYYPSICLEGLRETTENLSG